MGDVKQLKIEEFSLVDFVMKIQQGIRDGYEVTDSSDDAPLQIGGGFYTIMRESVKPNVVIGKAVFEASLDTSKLKEQLKAGGDVEQALSDSLIIGEVDYTKDADKRDNKELGVDEAFVGTVEPPKEPTLDEILPKDEQVIQTKQPTKRGRK